MAFHTSGRICAYACGMTPAQKLKVRQAETRARLGEISNLDGDEYTDDIKTEEGNLIAEMRGLDQRLIGADLAVDGTEPQVVDTAVGDPARLELRSRCQLGAYLLSAFQGRQLAGAEAELVQELGLTAGQVPLEIFETRAISQSLTTGTGVNVEPIHPAIFARSILPRLGVAMPSTPSGAFSTMTVSTSLTAAARAKDTNATADRAVLTPQTTLPHNVSARLSLNQSDILTIGVGNFESILRQNLMLALSDELDNLGLTGTGSGDEPEGLYPQLTDPTDPGDVATWIGFIQAAAGGIDGGPWSESLEGIRLVVNSETMRLAETTFQAGSGSSADDYTPGEMSAAAYLRSHTGGFFASSRMPDTASTIAGAILYRAGTQGLDNVNALTTATCPVWDYLSIDDPYSNSAKAQHNVTMHAFVGDVLIQQPSAYSRVDLKLS